MGEWAFWERGAFGGPTAGRSTARECARAAAPHPTKAEPTCPPGPRTKRRATPCLCTPLRPQRHPLLRSAGGGERAAAVRGGGRAAAATGSGMRGRWLAASDRRAAAAGRQQRSGVAARAGRGRGGGEPPTRVLQRQPRAHAAGGVGPPGRAGGGGGGRVSPAVFGGWLGGLGAAGPVRRGLIRPQGPCYSPPPPNRTLPQTSTTANPQPTDAPQTKAPPAQAGRPLTGRSSPGGARPPPLSAAA